MRKQILFPRGQPDVLCPAPTRPKRRTVLLVCALAAVLLAGCLLWLYWPRSLAALALGREMGAPREASFTLLDGRRGVLKSDSELNALRLFLEGVELRFQRFDGRVIVRDGATYCSFSLSDAARRESSFTLTSDGRVYVGGREYAVVSDPNAYRAYWASVLVP